jgi:hypothetical protein
MFDRLSRSVSSRLSRRVLNARYLLIAACLIVAPGLAKVEQGWELQNTEGHPGFATAVPSSTNLNIENVVLACERADDGGVLQLQLHPTGDDVSVRAIGPAMFTYGRRADIKIDDRAYSANVLLADDYVVLANETRGRFSKLSDSLLDAMATGRTMSVRLSVDLETISKERGVDGYATVDLRAGQGAKAVAALRRCAASAGA